jgi:hypothetical protein
MNLSDLFHSAQVMLEQEPEAIAGVLLELACRHRAPTPAHVVKTFLVAPAPYAMLHGSDSADWPSYLKHRVLAACEEALVWLIREGVIIRNPAEGHDNNQSYIFTRRGETFTSRADIAAHREASLLPRALVHAGIAGRVVPMFLRGDHEVAVVQAFIAVEVAVRSACPAPLAELVGVKLMRKAFDKVDGPLSDLTLVEGEREGEQHLFAGAIAHGKNPGSHREVVMSRTEAARLIMLASHLLSIVERRAGAPATATPGT